MITFNLKQKIKELAQKTNNEICGFVTTHNLYPCRNQSDNPKNHFLISPIDYLKINTKEKIEFIYHSHEKGEEFSEFDKLNLYNLKLRGLVYCKETDSFNYFFPESYKNKYVGRRFEIGVSDCLTLITDYYKNELNITLPEIQRNENWYEKNPDLVNKSIPAFLNKIPLETAQKHDIIVFDMLNNGNPNHFGIYLDNDLILHHPRRKFSTVEILTKKHKEKIPYALRVS